MNSIYREYEKHFSDYELRPHERPVIKIFKERGRYESVAPTSLSGTGGGFVAGSNQILAFKENRTREEVLSTLYHEGFHQFLYNRVSRKVPIWLNEGLAEYFAEATWDGDAFIMGQKPVQRIHALQDAARSGTLMPMQKLLSMKEGEWAANVQSGSRLARLQYNQAWSIIHFLLHANDGRYADRLDGYLKSRVRWENPARAFRSNFGRDIRAMQSAWKDYIMELEPDPISRCRHNMKTLMSRAAGLRTDPRDLAGIKDILSQLSESGVYRHYANNCCDTSYILQNTEQGDMPELFCMKHPGIVIRAYMVRDGGGWKTETEIMAENTLPEDLLRTLVRE